MVDKKIIEFRLPNYITNYEDWVKYRLTYRGGPEYRLRYLKYFTKRETKDDFQERLSMTPIPTFAKAALNEIRNSIFQRLIDVIRKDGSQTYNRAVAGFDMGVDLRGSSMAAFIGKKILEDLLVIGRVGIFVDAPDTKGETLADVGKFRPYLYQYPIENILSYACADPEVPSEFSALLLQDTCTTYDHQTHLPLADIKRYRHLWINENGRVNVQFYDPQGSPIDRDGNPAGPSELELTRIPFVFLDIGTSLLRDAAEYQIALINLVSSDVNYAIKANFPFYTEQKDTRNVGAHLKSGANDGTASVGGQGAADTESKVGVTQGRYYPKDFDRPGFIHPSSEPLEASKGLQEKFEGDIRRLVNLAVQSLSHQQSAESKTLDNAGLESGLSYIGLVLESAERQVSEHWAAYEESNRSKRKIPVIKYPDRYSLKSDESRIDEAGKLSAVITDTPSRTARKELWKQVCTTLLGGRVNPDTMAEIYGEIDDAKFTTANPEIIIQAKEAGLVGDKLASIALGFPDQEYKVAQKDHTERITRIADAQLKTQVKTAEIQADAQAKAALTNPGARGVDDLSDDPANEGKEEKKDSRDTTLKDNTKKPVRGDGK